MMSRLIVAMISKHLASRPFTLYLQPPAQIEQIAASKLKRDSPAPHWWFNALDPCLDR